jgi:hypothetical protein
MGKLMVEDENHRSFVIYIDDRKSQHRKCSTRAVHNLALDLSYYLYNGTLLPLAKHFDTSSNVESMSKYTTLYCAFKFPL